MENENPEITQTSRPAGQVNLPKSVGVLVMGILSIAICWCYGIPGIVLGIISLTLGGKGKKLYKANPDAYTLSSYKNIKAGYVCAIIGLSVSSAYLIFILLYLLILGVAISTAFSSMPWDAYNY